MKKTTLNLLIILILTMLIILEGCAPSTATVSTSSASTMVQVSLVSIPDALKSLIAVPSAYQPVTEMNILPVNIGYTVYTFKDSAGTEHFRAFGYRTDSASGQLYDIGFYEISFQDRAAASVLPGASATATGTESSTAILAGNPNIVLVFDAINAKPVDLNAEASSYALASQTQEASTSASTGSGKHNSGSSSSNSGSNTNTNTNSNSGSAATSQNTSSPDQPYNGPGTQVTSGL